MCFHLHSGCFMIILSWSLHLSIHPCKHPLLKFESKKLDSSYFHMQNMLLHEHSILLKSKLNLNSSEISLERLSGRLWLSLTLSRTVICKSKQLKYWFQKLLIQASIQRCTDMVSHGGKWFMLWGLTCSYYVALMWGKSAVDSAVEVKQRRCCWLIYLQIWNGGTLCFDVSIERGYSQFSCIWSTGEESGRQRKKIS